MTENKHLNSDDQREIDSNRRAWQSSVTLPMPSPTALVKPELLRWARASSGLTADVAAAKVPVKAEKLVAWEAGASAPTIAQLRKLGNAYKRPLSVFFLPQPPKGWDAMHDARRVDLAAADDESPELRLAVREVWERRAVIVDLVDDLDLESSFKVTATTNDDPELVANRIRRALAISVSDQEDWRSANEAFGKWRTIIENLGILVFSFPGVQVDEIRGFSISADPIHAIALNSTDLSAAKTFTLMHELAHIAVRSGAIMCEPHSHADASLEAFCNHVAGAILVPREALMDADGVRQATERTVWSDSELKGLSLQFSVSREVVLRRLRLLRKTSESAYSIARVKFRTEYEAMAARQAAARAAQDGGPGYIPTKLSQLGKMYAGTVLDAYSRGTITLNDACGFLGVKTNHLSDIQADPAMRTG